MLATCRGCGHTHSQTHKQTLLHCISEINIKAMCKLRSSIERQRERTQSTILFFCILYFVSYKDLAYVLKGGNGNNITAVS